MMSKYTKNAKCVRVYSHKTSLAHFVVIAYNVVSVNEKCFYLRLYTHYKNIFPFLPVRVGWLLLQKSRIGKETN